MTRGLHVGLHIDVHVQRGDFVLDLRCDVSAVTFLRGHNGAGKTTVLRAVLGLEAPTRGRIALGDRVLLDTASAIDLPPEARHIGWVPQGAALFPHLTARANVAFATRDRRPEGLPSATPADPMTFLAQIGATHLADRSARVLSGGERQRVALARALACMPQLLLLDEPLAALDPNARAELRELLAKTLPELAIPTLIVTHDDHDVAAIGGAGAKVLVLERGQLRS